MCRGPVFFFNDTATTEIYPLSLHDALPIFNGNALTTLFRYSAGGTAHTGPAHSCGRGRVVRLGGRGWAVGVAAGRVVRSEEHTSELQSRQYLVCRLLLEKKKKLQSSH